MSDFHQHGLISTLQELGPGNRAHLETELGEFAARSPIALILPCHGRDLGEPALESIIRELAEATFLSEIVVSMNGLDEVAYGVAQAKFSKLSQRYRLLWNDGPELRPLYEARGHYGEGKGFNVWAASDLLCREGKCHWLVTQDCDVMSFQCSTLARLCYASVCLGYEFSKMYYSRVTDRIYGRVSRLFLAPLLQALIRVSGHHPLLDFLLSFRYPLSGECVMHRSLAERLFFSKGWGLEIGILCEVFRRVSPRKVCQVGGNSHYDHKHQPMSGPSGGLEAMAREIALILFRNLSMEGIRIDGSFLSAVRSAYTSEASEALVRFQNLARINGLPFLLDEERTNVKLFARALDAAADGLS